MKKSFILFALITSIFAFTAIAANAQKPELKVATPESKTDDETQAADPIFEADALHNLEAARTYFRPRKAYIAVLQRFEETFAAYPIFTKMDEFLYLAGMSSFYLSDNKGKQKLDIRLSDEQKAKYTPEKLREDAKTYLTMVVEKYPKSKFKSDAEKTLKSLK